jgi:hypothetical protein
MMRRLFNGSCETNDCILVTCAFPTNQASKLHRHSRRPEDNKQLIARSDETITDPPHRQSKENKFISFNTDSTHFHNQLQRSISRRTLHPSIVRSHTSSFTSQERTPHPKHPSSQRRQIPVRCTTNPFKNTHQAPHQPNNAKKSALKPSLDSMAEHLVGKVKQASGCKDDGGGGIGDELSSVGVVDVVAGVWALAVTHCCCCCCGLLEF